MSLLDASVAPSTVRKQQLAIVLFNEWLQSPASVAVTSATSIGNASPRDVAEFVADDEWHRSRGLSKSRLRSIVTAVGSHLRRRGLPDVASAPIVRAAISAAAPRRDRGSFPEFVMSSSEFPLRKAITFYRQLPRDDASLRPAQRLPNLRWRALLGLRLLALRSVDVSRIYRSSVRHGSHDGQQFVRFKYCPKKVLPHSDGGNYRFNLIDPVDDPVIDVGADLIALKSVVDLCLVQQPHLLQHDWLLTHDRAPFLPLSGNSCARQIRLCLLRPLGAPRSFTPSMLRGAVADRLRRLGAPADVVQRRGMWTPPAGERRFSNVLNRSYLSLLSPHFNFTRMALTVTDDEARRQATDAQS